MTPTQAFSGCDVAETESAFKKPRGAVTHTGNTTEEFERIVKDWIATARHPKTGKHFTEMVYQPMLEVLACLREWI